MQAMSVRTLMLDFGHNLLTRVALREAKLIANFFSFLDILFSNLTGDVILIDTCSDFDPKMR